MKNKTKIFFIMILILSTISINAYAYAIIPLSKNFSTNQYDLQLVYRQFGSHNHSTAVNNARIAWNESVANIYIESASPNTGENFVVDSDDYGNTNWHGLCTPPTLYLFNPNTSFIKINDYYYYSFNSHTAELVAHEMGHSLRLNDVSDSTVLMLNSGYKGSVNPEEDDVNGVNSNYK